MFYDLSGRLSDLVIEIMEGLSGVATRAMTLVVPPPPGGAPKGASYNGNWLIYPASVSKLFILALVHAAAEAGSFTPSDEDARAMDEMIRQSSNDATGYLIDRLSGAPNGPPDGEGFERFARARGVIDDLLRGWGWRELERCRVRHKTYGDGPFGAEAAYLKLAGRNQLTTDAVARLLVSLDAGVVASAARSAAMLELMDRTGRPGAQTAGFLGAGLSPGARIWSKAGWTSAVRHDAALLSFPDGRRVIVVIFLEGPQAAGDAAILPAIAATLEARAPSWAEC